MISKEMFVTVMDAMKQESEEITRISKKYIIPHKKCIGERYPINADDLPLVDVVYDLLVELTGCGNEWGIFTWWLWDSHKTSYKKFIKSECNLDIEDDPKLETAEEIYDYLYEKYMKNR